MKRSYLSRVLCLLLSLLLGLLCLLPAAAEEAQDDTVTLLFTHDLHSQFLPADVEGGQSGGYARLYTLLEQQRAKYAGSPVFTVDAGDFSMGTLFQAAYATDALELRIMGRMGFDVTTLGNHEFDYRAGGLSRMLNSAVASGETLPPIVQCNYTTVKDDVPELSQAFENYGVRDYIVLERQGLRLAFFGLMGPNADSCAPMSSIVYEDYLEQAQRVVSQIQANEDYDYIVCLSHGGTSKDADKSEDEILAEKVDGIDVIVSGHTHTTLDEPLQVNDTLIVSCGSACANLGVLRFNRQGLVSYELLPVDQTVADHPEISAVIDEYKDAVTASYLSQYGLEFDSVLASSEFSFGEVGGPHRDKPLGNLITDSYVYAVQQAEGDAYQTVDVAINAVGVIRAGIAAGEITVSDAFQVLSLGVGADGSCGYPLVSFYLYGSELEDGVEVDGTVTSLMPEAQLYATGLHWEVNTNRMLFNKVMDCGLVRPDGSREPLEDDRLYRVVCGLFCCQMLSTVEDASFGILSLTPRNADGSVVTDYDSIILHDAQGREVKEWYALASYIDSFEGDVVPDSYRSAREDKLVYSSWNPVKLLKNPNLFTWLALLLILLIGLLIFFVTRKIIRSVKKRKLKKAAAQSKAAGNEHSSEES